MQLRSAPWSRLSGVSTAVFMCLSLLWLVLHDIGCTSSKGTMEPTQSPVVPVSIDAVVARDVPIEVNAIGTVMPYSAVSVKSMVSGQLLKVHFVEGQEVRKGALLFEIDPRPFEADLQRNQANLARSNAALLQAKANLERDMAQAENARIQKRRYEEMLEQRVISKEQSDQMATNANVLEAILLADGAAIESSDQAIRADRAAIENSMIQRSYCSIYAPIDGRTGSLIVNQGNLVKANDIGMVVINQVSPIYVDFSVPEGYLPEIRGYMAKGKIRVSAVPQNESPSFGTLTFVDNKVDPATGTIKLKATFQNEERRLWPGQFVNVTVSLSTQPNALLVPNRAVQSGQNGPFVFVVKSDSTVEARPVKPGRVFGDETVVEEGVRAEEKIVTDGQLLLVPGTRVQIKESVELEQGNQP